MKKLILILFSLLLCLSSYGYDVTIAQEEEYTRPPFKSVLNNGMARWSMLHGSTHIWGSHDIIVYNDTLINGLLYKKIYEHSTFFVESNEEWKNYEHYLIHHRDTYIGNLFIRESEDVSRLYIFDATRNEEFLISDLNLQVGDLFVGSIFSRWWSSITVSAYVDSVFVKDGLKHVQLDFYLPFNRYGYGKLTFIEGIGPSTGIIHSEISPFNCFQNDILFYQSEVFSYPLFGYHCGWRCTYGANLKEIDSENCTVQVESGNLIIACNTFQDVQVTITNMHGQHFLNTRFSELQNISISVDNFPRGVYVLRVFDISTNRFYTTKIIL